ncbi:MAG: WLM domain-containing protein [Benjaminiella poitrasii]|nr:MAG: WLM domain-containing protein [Benjaminiella poitrasii]
MSNLINFKVSFKSKIINFNNWDLQSTVDQIKNYLEEKTTLPKDSQKLLWKGRILKDGQVNLKELTVQEGSKLMLMGTLPTQIEQVNKMDKRIEEQKRIAPSLRLKRQQHPKKSGPDPNSTYTFHKISVIDEFPNPEKARKLLEKLRDDRGVKAIMAEKRWSVGELTELTPFEASILGYNRNKGELIAIRLRTDDLSGFRYYDSIRKVLLHELTHNVWSDHDDNFHALNRQLNKDVVSLDWTAHGAHTLSSGDYYNPINEEEELENDITYEAGTYKLGSNSSNISDTMNTPETRRQRLAAAALSRLTKKEEKELDEGCGSINKTL